MVEKLIECENIGCETQLGGGDTSNHKRQKINPKVLTKGETPGTAPDRVQPTILKDKWKIGAGLTKRDQLDVLRGLHYDVLCLTDLLQTEQVSNRFWHEQSVVQVKHNCPPPIVKTL